MFRNHSVHVHVNTFNLWLKRHYSRNSRSNVPLPRKSGIPQKRAKVIIGKSFRHVLNDTNPARRDTRFENRRSCRHRVYAEQKDFRALSLNDSGVIIFVEVEYCQKRISSTPSSAKNPIIIIFSFFFDISYWTEKNNNNNTSFFIQQKRSSCYTNVFLRINFMRSSKKKKKCWFNLTRN